uniref:Uncharacterized protein n=1 Tax=Rhizophora mucronata TaxID=61149 RepID=A0A2P2Q441_RHIMU
MRLEDKSLKHMQFKTLNLFLFERNLKFRCPQLTLVMSSLVSSFRPKRSILEHH